MLILRVHHSHGNGTSLLGGGECLKGRVKVGEGIKRAAKGLGKTMGKIMGIMKKREKLYIPRCQLSRRV